MTSYQGESAFEHGNGVATGALLVNLGTPDAPTPAAVRRFLAQFLWDPRVVEAPRWLWWFALHGVILRIRPSRSAHAYRQIWTPEGSPLLLHTRALVDRVRDALQRHLPATVVLGFTVRPAFPPRWSSAQRWRAQADRVAAVSAVLGHDDRIGVRPRHLALQRWRWVPELRFIGNYHDEPATSTRSRRAFAITGARTSADICCSPRRAAPLSARRRSLSLPVPQERAAGRGTARARSDCLERELSVAGRARGMAAPVHRRDVAEDGARGQRRVSVVCPGFATDCLETLEEIAIRNRALFMANGGEFYDYIPALNASDAHAELLAGLIAQHARGWPAALPASRKSRGSALRQGAAR